MLEQQKREIQELHWQFDLLASIEVGLVVIDRDFNVSVWNQFMQNHSNILPADIKGCCLLDFFAEINRDWFARKVDSVFKLANPAFIVWEQRPYLFKFVTSRPITSATAHMYQNVTLFPLMSLNGKVDKVCIVIYDVTDQALARRSIQSLNRRLEASSRLDGLTGLNNRTFWQEQFELEFKRTQRNQAPVSLIMLDIDHFKKINDTYGHQAGDAVIKSLATIIKNACRETDCCGRYGGEEFTVLLPDTRADCAQLVAERIRNTAEQSLLEFADKHIRFTVSLGIAQYANCYQTPQLWLEQADRALYQAKKHGRNQLQLA